MMDAFVSVILGLIVLAAGCLIPTIIINLLHRDRCLHTFTQIANNGEYIILVCVRKNMRPNLPKVPKQKMSLLMTYRSMS